MSKDDDATVEIQQIDPTGFNPKLRDHLAEFAEDMLLADGFDDCVIGTCYTPGPGFRAVYSVDKMIEKLMARDGLTYETAMEHFEFNIEGGYHGEKTPIFLRLLEDFEPV
jgi:hypothetical protein